MADYLYELSVYGGSWPKVRPKSIDEFLDDEIVVLWRDVYTRATAKSNRDGVRSCYY